MTTRQQQIIDNIYNRQIDISVLGPALDTITKARSIATQPKQQVMLDEAITAIIAELNLCLDPEARNNTPKENRELQG